MTIAHVNGKQGLFVGQERLRIAWDWDDTITKDMKAMVLAILDERYGIAERHGIPATIDSVREYRIQDIFTSLETPQVKSVFDEVYRNPERIQPAHPELKRILRGISGRAYNHLVTSTTAPQSAVSYWLRINGIAPHFISRIFVEKPSTKVKIGGLHACVEDDGRTAESFADAGKLAILLKKPWNEDAQRRADEERREGTNGSLIFPIDHLGEVEGILEENVHLIRRS